jgi:hypothetical protein
VRVAVGLIVRLLGVYVADHPEGNILERLNEDEPQAVLSLFLTETV